MTGIQSRRRGVAVPETALTIGFTMLLLFAALRLTLVTYFQAQTDVSTFVAAHTVAQNPQSSQSADQSYASTVLQSLFPHIQVGSLVVTPSAKSVSATLTQTADGLPVPGAPATIALGSHMVEPIAAATPGTLPPLNFSVGATLSNYCATPPSPNNGVQFCLPQQQPYQFYIAQRLATSGNGLNGRVTEWVCHSNAYNKLATDFPSSRPTPGPSWDPGNGSSPENPIYAWDTGNHTCH